MITRELKYYIVQSLQGGLTKSEIFDELGAVGWSQEDVEGAYRQIRQTEPPEHREDAFADFRPPAHAKLSVKSWLIIIVIAIVLVAAAVAASRYGYLLNAL